MRAFSRSLCWLLVLGTLMCAPAWGWGDSADTESLGEGVAIPTPWDHPDVNILKQENERLHTSVVELLYKNGLLNADLKTLKDGNSELKLDDEWLKKKVKDLMGSSDTVKELQISMAKLNRDNDNLLKTNNELMEQGRTGNATIEGYKMQLAEKDAEIKAAQAGFNSTRKNMESRYSILEAVFNSTKKKEMNALGTVSNLTGQVTVLDEELEQSKSKIQMDEVRINSTLRAMQMKSKQAQALLNRTRTMAEKAHAAKLALMNETSQVAYLAKLRQGLIVRNEDLQAFAASLSTRLKAVHKQRKELTEENDKLSTELKAYQTKDAAERVEKAKEGARAKAAEKVDAEKKVKAEKNSEIKAKAEALKAFEAKRAAKVAHEDVNADNVLSALHGLDKATPAPAPKAKSVDHKRVVEAVGPQHSDCKGEWSECGVDCKKLWVVLKPKTGEGMHCEDERGMDVEHGDAFNCQPGQGQCPL